FDANSLLILAKALRGFNTVPRFGSIKAKLLYVLSRTDRLFPPELAPAVMPALKNAGVEADYFLLDSEYGHSASGLDAAKWAPRLRQFMEGRDRSRWSWHFQWRSAGAAPTIGPTNGAPSARARKTTDKPKGR